MSMLFWIRNLFTRPATRPIRKALPRARLTLEALENRWCPSTITVLDIGDAPGALTYTGVDATGTATYTAPTLRAAIDGANAMAGSDIINFDSSGVFSTPQTIKLDGTQLELTDTNGTTTITGLAEVTDPTGATKIKNLGVTVNGGGQSRVFQVDNMVTASITALTISGGWAAGTYGDGGGLSNLGNTTLSNCILSGNSAGYLSGGVYGGGDSTTTLTDCTVSGNSAVFGGGLDSHGTLTLNRCTVSNNTATQHGGGLQNYLGTTTLTDCTVSGNKSTYGGGGLFLVGGETTLTNCTISGNEASRGGALWAAQKMVHPSVFGHSSDNYLGTTTLSNCTVSGNKATSGSGGGVYNSISDVTLTNCTISGNTSPLSGGGVFGWEGQTTLTNCTLSGNSAPEGGGLWMSGLSASALGSATLLNCTVSANSATGGVAGGLGAHQSGGVSMGSVTLGNTIVAGNTTSGSVPDVYGPLVSLGNNLIGNTWGSSGWIVGSDLTGTASAPRNPLLAPLGNYGGPLAGDPGAPGGQQVLQTMALLGGSPAIDAGISGPGIPTTDQRGKARVGATDIGAFELQSATPPGAIATVYLSAPAATTAGQPVSVTVTVLDAIGNGATGGVYFSSSDLSAGLPNNYTFTAADAGRHTFSVTLKKAGTQSITVTDTLTGKLIATSGGIVVSPAAAAKFVLTAPQSVKHGVAFSLTLTVQDAYGNTVTGYVGTVKSDGTANLPTSYIFTNADQGVHTFTGLVLRKTGKQTITITDKLNSSLKGSLTVDVS